MTCSNKLLYSCWDPISDIFYIRIMVIKIITFIETLSAMIGWGSSTQPMRLYSACGALLGLKALLTFETLFGLKALISLGALFVLKILFDL